MNNIRVMAFFACLVGASLWTLSASAEPPVASDAKATPVTGTDTATAPKSDAKEQPAKKPAPYQTKGVDKRVKPDLPSYAKQLNEYGWAGTEKIDWFDFGLEHRTRYEHRDDDPRRPDFEEDDQFLMRSRAYMGVKKILDPLRLGVEFQDSRQFNSDWPETNRDVDENDFLQAFGELYFKDALGKDQPLALRAGRMTLEYTDRQNIARGNWGNTVNAFDGFRLRLGEMNSDWQFDFFAAQPVERRMRQPDRADEERWVYGLVGAWRKWNQYITLEPYYFILTDNRKDPAVIDREIHTTGLRVFGPIAGTNFDYDLDGAFQFGEDGQRRQRAQATSAELGYTFENSWKPRLSGVTILATGDRDPNDNFSERFFRMYDSAHHHSAWDLWTWQNVISPRVRLELQPTQKLKFDTSYAAFWLASDSDAWVVPNRRDPTGQSGNFVGQEVDMRLRYQLDPRVEIEIGYVHFFAGPFVDNTGPSDDADFFYVSTTLKL